MVSYKHMKSKKEKRQSEQIKNLERAIDSYMISGKSLVDFINECSFKEYGKTGNKKLAKTAAEYFADKLE